MRRQPSSQPTSHRSAAAGRWPVPTPSSPAPVRDWRAARHQPAARRRVSASSQDLLSPQQLAEVAGDHLARPEDWISRVRLTDRKSTRLNSSHVEISYAVFCLKKKKKKKIIQLYKKKKKKKKKNRE